MPRAKYQVLVIPYLIEKDNIQYCIFKRNDMEDCWQFIAGGGETADITPMISAKREAYEEANIPTELHFIELETNCSISTEHFKNARKNWGEQYLVIPEYCFAVELKEKNIKISHEHISYRWVDYETAKQKLKYDSNKVALWELDNKIKLGMIK